MKQDTQPQLSQAIHLCRKATDQLESLKDELNAKLDCVMVPACPPEAPLSTAEEAIPTCPAAHDLNVISDRLFAVSRHIEELVKRLQT